MGRMNRSFRMNVDDDEQTCGINKCNNKDEMV